MRKHGEATKASIAWLLSFVSLYSLRGFHWLLSLYLVSLFAAMPLGVRGRLTFVAKQPATHGALGAS